MDNYLGEIRLFPYPTVIPKGWVPCNGQTLPVMQNQALFALLGNSYGGDGKTNFMLPNLNGRVIMGMNNGQNSNQPVYTLGQAGGSETVALTANQIPPHSHSFTAAESYDQLQPNTNYLSNTTTPSVSAQANKNSGNAFLYATSPAINTITALNAASVTPAGNPANSVQGHPNMQPYIAMVYCIATQGIWPSRP